VASHDLQEPLRKIVSFGERLNTVAGPMLDGDARHHLERILSAATRMRTLISGLLAYSQVSARVQPFAPTDMGDIAREVIADLETALVDAGARVELGALPVIEADALQMRQLLQNLLANAIKFRRADRPSVVRVSAMNGGDHCSITVSDNGIGFQPEYAKKIFGIFERLHGRARYDGSGIGLAICQLIAERHNGTIDATSTVDEGATFTVTLPVSQAATELIS
jgi:light-regulated signal transduction histidine kinase (bacteriophytochrome)